MVAPIDDGNPPPAPDYPPENAFDVQAFTTGVLGELQKHWPVLLGPAGVAVDIAKSDLKSNVALMTLLGELVLAAEKAGMEFLVPILKAIIEAVGVLMAPGMEALGELTGVYTKQLVDSQAAVQRGDVNDPHPKLQSAAAGMFDGVLAPLAGLVGAHNPATAGAGQANSQFALGSIVNIHLATWMVNIISNLTGMGALKWINSFDDVITTAINSRALGRIAMKPYLTKFMADPLERDLNKSLPLDSGSASSLLKSYIRGALSREQLIDKLRGKGYDESVAEQLLIDTVKLLGLDEMVWLVNRGAWTKEMAWDMLKQQGYPEPYAPVVFEYAQSALQRSIWHSIASDCVTAMGNHQIDNETVRKILANSELTEDEVNVYVTKGALQAETPKRLSYSQVKQLYAESLVDLNYVQQWLRDESYSDGDSDLLVLLEFTKKEDLEQRKKDLADARRVADEEKRRAKILLELSQAARAEKYGIPWPPP